MKANEHAVELGKLRWQGKSQAERKEHAKMMAKASLKNRKKKSPRTTNTSTNP